MTLVERIEDYFLRAPSIREAVQVRLEPRLQHATDWIVADLFHAALARKGLGTSPLDRLVRVYSAGGWPVGFDGEFGSGRILAVFPGNAPG